MFHVPYSMASGIHLRTLTFPKQMFYEMKTEIRFEIVWLLVIIQNVKRKAFTIIECQPFFISPSFHLKLFVWVNGIEIECQPFHRKPISIIEHPKSWQQQMFHYHEINLQFEADDRIDLIQKQSKGANRSYKLKSKFCRSQTKWTKIRNMLQLFKHKQLDHLY